MMGKRTKRWLIAGAVSALVALASFVVYRTRTGGAGAFGSIERLVLDQSSSGEVDWRVVAHGFEQVTDIQFVPGESRRAIVLGKEGAARLITLSPKRAVSAASSKLVFEVEVKTASELGLLGLAFHPDYLQNGLFYVNYTPLEGPQRTRVSEWELPALRLGHQPAKERHVVLEVEQPFPNHNAGQLAFGRDGMLYVGLGDGGKRADPHENGQNLSTLLGSMLRIDVDGRDPGLEYAIPPDNPFVGKENARGEIWAYGLRNPWRYSFDPQGRLIVADVGQDEFEELDIVVKRDNLASGVREASHCFPPGAACQSAGFVDPVFEYPRGLGRSITGGYVYLGSELPSLSGRYLCADYTSGNLWALELPGDRATHAKSRLLGTWSRSITTFGRAANGEIFAGDFSSGELLKLVGRKPSR